MANERLMVKIDFPQWRVAAAKVVLWGAFLMCGRGPVLDRQISRMSTFVMRGLSIREPK